MDLLLITMVGCAINIALTYSIIKELKAPKIDKVIILTILWGTGIIAEIIKLFVN